jgi:hypothetical protein
LSSAPHPISDEGPLVFGHRPADLEEEPVVGIITHRSIQKHNFAAKTRELVQDDHLLDVVAGQAIRFRQEDTVHIPITNGIPQAIEAGAIEIRATAAVITEDMGVLQVPPLISNIGT